MKPTIIHINRGTIDSNRKRGTRYAPIIVRKGRTRRYGHRVEIRDRSGEVVAAFIHSPDKPLDCGARVWVEVYEGGRVAIRKAIESAACEVQS